MHGYTALCLTTAFHLQQLPFTCNNCLSFTGPRWGRWLVWPCQWANLIGALVSVFIQSGESFQVRPTAFHIALYMPALCICIKSALTMMFDMADLRIESSYMHVCDARKSCLTCLVMHCWCLSALLQVPLHGVFCMRSIGHS